MLLGVHSVRSGSEYSAVWRRRVLTLARLGVEVSRPHHSLVFAPTCQRMPLFGEPPFLLWNSGGWQRVSDLWELRGLVKTTRTVKKLFKTWAVREKK